MNIRIKKTPPAQRLPFDVLWFLFRYVVAVDGDAGPTTISHVCKLWRQSALDTPLLWTKITMRLYFYKQKHQRAEARFNRSANLPLDLTFHCSRNLQEPERDSLIIPHAHRIRRLVVHSKGGILSEWMWMRLNIHMPRLEEFTTIISRCPALHAVRKVTSLENLNSLVPFVPNNRPTAWLGWVTRGLTTLKLATLDFCTEISMMELFSILEYAAVTLQEFEYEGYTPRDEPFHSFPPLSFPQLRKLAVSFVDDISPLLFIFFPASLDSLTLRNFKACPSHGVGRDINPDFVITDPLVWLLPIIGQWNTITHLELFAIGELPRNQILDYIRSLDRLESLVLYGVGGPECFAQELIRDPEGSGPLLPKLKRLLCTAFNSGLDVILLLLSRRFHQLSRLDKLTIDSNLFSFLVEQDSDSLSILKDAALEVMVVDDPILQEYVPLNEVLVLTNEHVLQQPITV